MWFWKENMMKGIGKLAIAASAVFWISAAVAQDADTTVTTHSGPPPAPGAYVGVPGVAGVGVGPGSGYVGGCEHRSKTVTNEDTGETYHKSETRC
jgi:uncharacterized protein YraI